MPQALMNASSPRPSMVMVARLSPLGPSGRGVAEKGAPRASASYSHGNVGLPRPEAENASTILLRTDWTETCAAAGAGAAAGQEVCCCRGGRSLRAAAAAAVCERWRGGEAAAAGVGPGSATAVRGAGFAAGLAAMRSLRLPTEEFAASSCAASAVAPLCASSARLSSASCSCNTRFQNRMTWISVAAPFAIALAARSKAASVSMPCAFARSAMLAKVGVSGLPCSWRMQSAQRRFPFFFICAALNAEGTRS
mmetsp:Transcript_23111/g.72463  ORF Transcript_23111/g.72463 Transcript_23111/m.72463 type:complete len:252 (-) Transcript_23111:167-922(-)